MSLGFARPEKHNTAALAWARHIWFNPRLPGTPPKAGALCCDWWCLFFVLMTGRGKVSLGFARPEKHHAELSWARHIWFNPRLPGTPPRQELCVATGRGEGVAGLCSTREAPRRTGVGPAYLVQPKATWHSPLGKSSMLRLARGRCRWVLLDQRGTTPHRRGPGISDSTQGYLALPSRA